MNAILTKLIRYGAMAAGAAMLALGLCGCNTEELENIHNRLTALEGGEIPSVNQQITGIQGTIPQLQAVDTELRALIDALEENLAALTDSLGKANATVEAVQAAIVNLKSKDAAIELRIDKLKGYVDSLDAASRDWVQATFATLEQYNSAVQEAADIRAVILSTITNLETLEGTVEARITTATNAVSALETSMKTWIGEQLTGYWTIAQAQAQFDLLPPAIKTVDDSLSSEINQVRTDISTAASELTTAYQAAIETAITAHHGTITAQLAADVAAAQAQIQESIDAVNAKLDKFAKRLNAVERNLAAAIASVQSVVAVPDYSDGSLRILSAGESTLRFEVQPLSAASKLAAAGKDVFTLECIETGDNPVMTTSPFMMIPVTGVSFDGEFLQIVADGSVLPDVVTCGADPVSARLVVCDSIVFCGSKYYPLVFDAGKYSITLGSEKVTADSYTLRGKAIFNTGAAVRYGFAYATTAIEMVISPTLVSSDNIDGSDNYSAVIEGLAAHTRYYYRSFLYRDGLYYYGDRMSFDTE